MKRAWTHYCVSCFNIQLLSDTQSMYQTSALSINTHPERFISATYSLMARQAIDFDPFPPRPTHCLWFYPVDTIKLWITASHYSFQFKCGPSWSYKSRMKLEGTRRVHTSTKAQQSFDFALFSLRWNQVCLTLQINCSALKICQNDFIQLNQQRFSNKLALVACF